MARHLLAAGPSLTTLHRDYAAKGRIDVDAPLTSTASTVIDAPADRVWTVVADLAGWERWAPAFRLVALDGVAPGAVFRWRMGGIPLRSTLAVVDPGRELTWTGRVLAYKAVDQHLLEPVDGGRRTRVTMRESLAGPLAPLLYGPDKLRAGHERWLAALKTAVEAR